MINPITAANIASLSVSSLVSALTPSTTNTSGVSNPSLTNIANFQTNTPDPIASSFSNGAPNASTFITRPYVSQVQPANLSDQSNLSSDLLMLLECPALAALAVRAGLEAILTDADMLLAQAVMFEQLVANMLLGLAASLASPCGDPAAMEAIAFGNLPQIPQTIALADQAVGLANFISNAGSLFSPENQAAFESVAAGVFVANMDSITDMNGVPIVGVNPDVPFSMYGDLTGLGVGFIPGMSITSAMDYLTQQNLFNCVLAMQIDNGMNSVVSQMCANTQWCNSTTVPMLKDRLVTASQSGNSTVAQTIINTIGPYNVANPEEVVSNLITNGTSSDVSNINNIMSDLGVSANSIFGQGTCSCVYNGENIWNANLITKASSDITAQLAPADVVATAQWISNNIAA